MGLSTGTNLFFNFTSDATSVAVLPVKPIFSIAVSKSLTAGTKARQALDSFETGVLRLMPPTALVHVKSFPLKVPSTFFQADTCLEVAIADAEAAWAPRPKTAVAVARAVMHFKRITD